MITTCLQKSLSIALSLLLVLPAASIQAAAQDTSAAYQGQGAPLSANELQQLVAPIALYPDALVAQILGASTFPDQVADANAWLQLNNNLTGTALETSAFTTVPAVDLEAVIAVHILGPWLLAMSGGPSLARLDGGAHWGFTGQLGVGWQP